MNKVLIIARICKDIELRVTEAGVHHCSFPIAVNRKYRNAEGENIADFFTAVAWRDQAEFIAKWFSKGSRIGIVGNLQSRSYDNAEGKKVYVVEIMIDEVEFIDLKKDSNTVPNPIPASSTDSIVKKYAKADEFYPEFDSEADVPFNL
jgi:single-strand DNA-binding protein